MILHELCGGEENHPLYQALEVANGNRQYDFLRSIVAASLAAGRPFLSEHLVKALNSQAIMCLHAYAGEYRPCRVDVGDYTPPAHHRVDGLMEDFVNQVNRSWEASDPITLAAFVLWRLNSIHPFINGNGRSARAASYFVLCVKVGSWLPGTTILPELLRRERTRYVAALKEADAGNLQPLHELMSELLAEQLNGVAPAAGPANPGPPTAPPLALPPP